MSNSYLHVALSTCGEDFYGAHVKATLYCDAYGYNMIHLNESSSASGNRQVVKACRAGLCRALCPESRLQAGLHTCSFLGSTLSGLTSAVSPVGLLCGVWSPCVSVSWAFFVSKWPSVQTACIVCITPAGLSHRSPPFVCTFCEA